MHPLPYRAFRLSATKQTRALAILFFVTAAVHANPAGKVKICRDPGIIAMMDNKSVVIPAGSHFAHMSSPGPGRVQHIIFTSAPVTIGPKPACAIVAAKEETNFTHTPITPQIGQFRPQFSIAGLDVFAVALEDFK